MKRTVLILSIALLSFTVGVLFASYLALRASVISLKITKLKYEMEQEVLAIRAKHDNNISKAILHYSNIVASKEPPGLRSFDPNNNHWGFDFPFTAIILGKITENTTNATNHRGVEADIGMAHGKLAHALEMAGLEKESQEEYQKASLLVRLSPEKVRSLVDSVTKFDSETSQAGQTALGISQK